LSAKHLKQELTAMANPEHLKILKQGVEAWNKWISEHPVSIPDLSGADLGNAILSCAILSGAILSGAILINTNLGDADLSGADFTYALLSRTEKVL
jgi:uncharacterized protein YjbI with pentapeptide repeats